MSRTVHPADTADRYRLVARHFYTTTARRPLPTWADRHPALEPHHRWGDVVRRLLTGAADSDALIRALHEHRHDRDAQLTLLVGVARHMKPGDITGDMLSHLAGLLAEPHPELERTTGLAVRLARAARQRAHRAGNEHRQPRLTLTGDLPSCIGTSANAIEARSDEALERVENQSVLDGFSAAIARAIAAGDLDATTWATYRSGITRRIDLDRHTPTPPAERMRFMRARRRIDSVIDLDSIAHTA